MYVLFALYVDFWVMMQSCCAFRCCASKIQYGQAAVLLHPATDWGPQLTPVPASCGWVLVCVFVCLSPCVVRVLVCVYAVNIHQQCRTDCPASHQYMVFCAWCCWQPWLLPAVDMLTMPCVLTRLCLLCGLTPAHGNVAASSAYSRLMV